MSDPAPLATCMERCSARLAIEHSLKSPKDAHHLVLGDSDRADDITKSMEYIGTGSRARTTCVCDSRRFRASIGLGIAEARSTQLFGVRVAHCALHLLKASDDTVSPGTGTQCGFGFNDCIEQQNTADANDAACASCFLKVLASEPTHVCSDCWEMSLGASTRVGWRRGQQFVSHHCRICTTSQAALHVREYWMCCVMLSDRRVARGTCR